MTTENSFEQRAFLTPIKTLTWVLSQVRIKNYKKENLGRNPTLAGIESENNFSEIKFVKIIFYGIKNIFIIYYKNKLVSFVSLKLYL